MCDRYMTHFSVENEAYSHLVYAFLWSFKNILFSPFLIALMKNLTFFAFTYNTFIILNSRFLLFYSTKKNNFYYKIICVMESHKTYAVELNIELRIDFF